MKRKVRTTKRAAKLRDKGFPSVSDIEKARKLAAKVGLLGLMEAESDYRRNESQA